MSELIKQVREAKQHKRPYPFPRIDMGPEVQPRYSIWHSELSELTAEIQCLILALEEISDICSGTPSPIGAIARKALSKSNEPKPIAAKHIMKEKVG